MRLQLVVQRHHLPLVRVLWTVELLRPPYAAAGASVTISQLLEQINEIIPLESEDWGLEDYSVEVRGFECLHFSEITQVLKEDDEVYIRPLQTSDLRFRKLSGRHQISTDGRHLIDGVVFGRPFLRRADRPAVKIPPRKRKREIYEEDSDNNTDDDYARNGHIVVRGRLDDAVNTTMEGDNGDEEYYPGVDENNDLLNELEDLRNDQLSNAMGEINPSTLGTANALNTIGVIDDSPRLTRSQSSNKGLGLQGPAMLKLLDENGRPYPGVYDNPLLDQYSGDKPPLNGSQKYGKKHGKKRRALLSAQIDTVAEELSRSPERVNSRILNPASKGVRFENIDSTTPMTIQEFEDSDQSNDKDFHDEGDVDVDLGESDKENSRPQLQDKEQTVAPNSRSVSISSITSEAESDSDTSSSSDSFFDITSSESEPEHSFSASKVEDEEQGPPSKSPSSNASSKSEGKKTLEKSKNNATMLAESEHHEAHDLMALITGKFKEDERPHPKPPYKGKIQTQMRNRRRRLTKKIQRLKSMGNLSPNTILMKVTELKSNGGKSKSEQCGRHENLQDSVTGSDNTLQAKKKSLLKAIDSNEPEHSEDLGKDGYEVDQTYSELSTPAHVKDLEPTDQSFVDQSFREREAAESNLSDTVQSREAVGISSPADNTPPELDAPESTKRRSKLDISSSRRLLFGSLGLRAPKNEDDESKIKEKLMKGIKPLTDFRSSRAGENGDTCAFDSAEGDEKWREKVVFKAVECCHDNIKLSTPPFPFVQRWDPQQQYPFPKTTRKGKKPSRRKKRSQASKSKMNDTPWQKSVSLEVESFPNDCSFDQPLDGQEQSTLYGESDDYRTAIKEQLMRETDASLGTSGEAEIAQDLPQLPGDMSICPLLTAETALPGAIVAFKQLDMSELTNWQPKMSEYRTARVDCVTDQGTLQMRLAKRDLVEKEDRYDERTGERIYSKFEMPGFNDEESQARNVIEISFSELIEPRLLHATDVDLSQDENQQYSSLRGGDSPTSANIAIEDGVGSSPMNLMVPSPTNPSFNSVDIHATEGANEEVRQEIFDLIKDAGWRSSIRSNNGEENGAERNNLPIQEQMNGVDKRNGDSVSSKFSGFGSSPPIIKSTLETGVRYDHLGGHTADSTLSSPHKSDLEIAESLPAQPIPTSESPSRNPPNNDDGEKDMKEEDNDHGIIQEIAWNKSQHGSDGMEVDHQILSQELPSETSLCQSVSYTVGSEAPNFHHSSGVPPEDTSSDNEFPSLENVFSQIRSSQARSSFEPSLLADEDTSYVDQSSYGSTLSHSGMTRKRSSQKVESDGQDNVSQKQPLFEWVDSDAQEDQSTPRASQMPLQSQIVDLTLSSDAVDQADVADPLDDSDYVDDGTQLPRGPGWVKKTRASMGQRDAGYSRASRSRSTGVF